MSSEKFELLEEDVVSLMDDTQSTLHSKLPGTVGEEQRRLVRSIQKNLEEAKSMLGEMWREVTAAPAPHRQPLAARHREHQRRHDGLSRGLANVTSVMAASSSHQGTGTAGAGATREELFTSRDSAVRAHLSHTSHTLARTTENLARTHQVAAETDQVGSAVIEELGGQREQLTRTRDRLHGTDENLTKSRKILRSMARRVVTNKFVLIVIILVEMAILGGLVYYRFFAS